MQGQTEYAQKAQGAIPQKEIREITLKDRSGNEAYDIAVQSLLRGLRVPPLPEEMRKEPFVAYTSFKYTKRT